MITLLSGCFVGTKHHNIQFRVRIRTRVFELICLPITFSSESFDFVIISSFFMIFFSGYLGPTPSGSPTRIGEYHISTFVPRPIPQQHAKLQTLRRGMTELTEGASDIRRDIESVAGSVTSRASGMLKRGQSRTKTPPLPDKYYSDAKWKRVKAEKRFKKVLFGAVGVYVLVRGLNVFP